MPKFFSFNAGGQCVVNAACLPLVDSVVLNLKICLRSNSKVVLNRGEFWTYFALPNFEGAVSPEVVHALLPPHRSTSCGKVSWGYFL